MKTAGIVIGVLMVGGAVVALSNNASASNTNVVNGCTFSNATNFNPNATVDNGTCLFEKQEDSHFIPPSMGGDAHFEASLCIGINQK